MTRAELSRRLALAIGYAPKNVHVIGGVCEVLDSKGKMWANGTPANLLWRFDYQDPTVWGPVLEWLMREHEPDIYYDENAFMIAGDGMWIHASTLAEAVALAAIAVKGGE